MRISEKEFAELTARCPQLAEKLKQPPVKPAARKYRNVKVYIYEDSFVSQEVKVDGHGKLTATFDSVKEYNRWCGLRLLERAGKISNLSRQTELIIQPKTKVGDTVLKKVAYKADFVYNRNGTTVVEDVKPFDRKTNAFRTTKDFRIKWKLLQAKYQDYSFEIF